MSKKFNNVEGAIGENIAKNYLKASGYRIVTTNFKNKIGEIDIVAYEKDILVFIEVKYRKTTLFGLPREAVDVRKQHKIRLVAMSYINKYRLHEKACRFDVLEILDNEVTLIKDCF